MGFASGLTFLSAKRTKTLTTRLYNPMRVAYGGGD